MFWFLTEIMSRNFPWRRHLSDAVCWHQAEAMNATIFILREMGPTGFLLKEEGENRNFKVSKCLISETQQFIMVIVVCFFSSHILYYYIKTEPND